MIKIGYYGGTFDPIHFGHLNVCYSILEAGLVDKIFIVPTSQSPLKENAPQASYADRIKMIELALIGEERIKILDLESIQPAYTIDTLEFLRIRYPHSQIRLILGSDLVDDFHKWKNYQDLILYYQPIVVSRQPHNLPEGMEFFEIPLMEISSTSIRNRVKNKLKIDHLVPSKVVDYIYSHHLYFLNFKEKKYDQ